MKTLVLVHVSAGAIDIPAGDVALLHENAFELDKGGELQILPKFIPLDKNIKFVFRCLATALRADYKLDTSTVGWNAFKLALGMRNRITHPRSAAELELTDDEMKNVQNAMAWFRTVTIDVVKKRGTTGA